MQVLESALAARKDERDAAELKAQQAQAEEMEVQIKLESQLSEFREQAATRDAMARSDQEAFRKAATKQADELRQALENALHSDEARTAAEIMAKAAEESRCNAERRAEEAEQTLAHVSLELQVAKDQARHASENLAAVQVEVGQLEAVARSSREEQALADSSSQRSSARLAEVEKLLKVAQAQSSRAESELQASLQQLAELEQAADGFQAQAGAAAARATDIEATAAAQQKTLRESLEKVAVAEENAAVQHATLQQSLERVAELESNLHDIQQQLQGENNWCGQ